MNQPLYKIKIMENLKYGVNKKGNYLFTYDFYYLFLSPYTI